MQGGWRGCSCTTVGCKESTSPSASRRALPCAQEAAARQVAEAEQQLGELSQEVQQYRDLNERYHQISEENRQLYNTVQVGSGRVHDWGRI